MSLKTRVKRDIERILGNSKEYGQMTFTNKPGTQTATITGIDARTHLAVDTDGNVINSRKANVSFPESALVNSGYTVRNIAGQVDLNGHFVNIVDSAGIDRRYRIIETMPDETIGLITCMLDDYE